MSGQARLIKNDMTSKGNIDGINEALAGDVDSKANSIKEVECESNYEKHENKAHEKEEYK